MYVLIRMVQEWRKKVLITSGSTADVDSRRYRRGIISRSESVEQSRTYSGMIDVCPQITR